MNSPIKLLLIFVDETDQWDGMPLYEAIVRRLRHRHIAGATVHIGVMGYGSHLRVHQKGLFGVSDDRPVTICVVDTETTLRQVLPDIRAMVTEGLVILLDAELVP